MRRVRLDVRAVGLVALAVIAGVVVLVPRNGSETPGKSDPFDGLLASAPDAATTTEFERVPIETAASTESTSRELPDGVWVRGRVVLPASTPPDGRVEVAARVLSFDDSPGYVAEIDDEGKFSVMFPEDVDSGWIEVHARYLVLQPNHEVDLEEESVEAVLEPVLGARVRGRLVAPELPESELRALAGTCVQISGNRGPGFQRFPPRRACVGEDMGFEFAALPPCAGYELSAEARDFLPFEQVFELPPGRTSEIDLALRAGVRVSGRVVDPDGKPVADAKLWRPDGPRDFNPDWAEEDATTGPDGSFSMTAVLPGDVAIWSKAYGFFLEVLELGPAVEVDERTGRFGYQTAPPRSARKAASAWRHRMNGLSPCSRVRRRIPTSIPTTFRARG